MGQTIFEQNGGKYIQQGDYMLPELTLPAEEEHNIGIWGQRRKRCLKEHHRVLYYNLLTSGKLNAHIADIEEQAEALFSRLVNELTEKENVSENLKANDYMAWVGMMNNIRSAAMEVVNKELIFI